MNVQGFAAEADSVLGDRLVAIYQFGSNFARGPMAKDARMLMIVSKVDPQLLLDVKPLAKRARNANLQLRFDTKNDLFCSADVFPVFTLELLDTKNLIRGTDVLGDLEIHPDHLRHRVEQSLRGLHRDLLRAYVAAEDDRGLVVDLRVAVRKSVYLLRALTLVCKLELPAVPAVELLIDEVIGKLVPDGDRAVWHRLRRMANFEEPTPPEQLVALYGDALQAFSQLVDAVDKL